MLTKQQPTASEHAPPRRPSRAALEDLIAYFEGDYVPLRDAKVSIMTHAFMYGTATFEGIRGYWNAEQGELYVLFLREHMERIRNSAKMLLMEDLPSVDELAAIVLETVRRNGFREDVVRPARRSTRARKAIGVRLHHLEHELYVIATPFGNYIDIEKGVRIMTSLLAAQRRRGAAGPGQDRRRLREHGVPEVRGGAQRLRRGAGPDARRPRVRGAPPRTCSSSATGSLLTPPVSDDILEGVTRKAILAAGAGPRAIPTEVRSIDRSELYVCDEIFLCGTGVQVSPVIEVDHRPVGHRARSARSRAQLSERYFAAVRGQPARVPELAHARRGLTRETASRGGGHAPARRRQPTASTSRFGRVLAQRDRRCPRRATGRWRS